MALQGYRALVKAESSQVPFTDEATTSGDNLNYQITDTGKQIIAFGSTVVVEDGGVPTTEDYTLSRLNGTVTFGTAVARTITITGDYVVLTTVAEAKAFTFDLSRELGDSTVFQESDRKFTPTLATATASLSQFYDTANYFIDMLLDGTTKVVELYADSTDDPIRIFANVSSDSIAVSVESLIEEGVTLQATGKMIAEV